MENDEEPIIFMARIMYTLLFEDGQTTTVHSWDELSERTRHDYCVVAAKSFNAYFEQRKHLKDRASRR